MGYHVEGGLIYGKGGGADILAAFCDATAFIHPLEKDEGNP